MQDILALQGFDLENIQIPEGFDYKAMNVLAGGLALPNCGGQVTLTGACESSSKATTPARFPGFSLIIILTPCSFFRASETEWFQSCLAPMRFQDLPS